MKIPLTLLPGLLCDDALWEPQLAALSDIAEITVADLTRDESLPLMAARVLAEAPSASRWPACRWADISPRRSCGRRPSG